MIINKIKFHIKMASVFLLVANLIALSIWNVAASEKLFYDVGAEIKGVAYELPTDNYAETLECDFERMVLNFGINCINVYDLESRSHNEIDVLFAKLQKYNLKTVIRLEAYPKTFCFSDADIEWILDRYTPLIEYISKKSYSEYISYLALNMPVDDITVQNNMGGLNTENYILSQVSYSENLVSTVRSMTASVGFDDAKIYLSVFYGWDNTYLTPSYSSSGADGYFMNNYSYPLDDIVPDNNCTDSKLINSGRLSVAMEKFKSQYSDMPLVMEFGFHTVAFNNGSIPNQTAGLVLDRVTKERAIKATLRFYKQNYGFVEGFQYFGYNILKNEGEDNALLDWQLFYPEDSETINIPLAEIRNADFSSSTEFWGVTGNFSAEEGVSSEYESVKLILGDSGRDLFQSSGWFVPNVKIDGPCVLSADINTFDLISGGYKITAEFKRDGKTVNFYSSPLYSDKFSGWRRISVCIPEDAAGVYDEILYKIELSGGEGCIYADDFTLLRDDNLIFNGSFENGNNIETSEWGIAPSYQAQNFMTSLYSRSGMRSIKVDLSDNQAYSVYCTPVNDGACSAINCEVYIAYENVENAEMYFHINRGNTVVNSKKYLLTGSSNGFVKFGFTVPYDSAAEYAQFQLEIGTGSGSIWIDDVSLEIVSGTENDSNNDGIFDIKDLIALKKHILNADNCMFAVSDIKKDGALNSDDLVMIRKKLLFK